MCFHHLHHGQPLVSHSNQGFHHGFFFHHILFIALMELLSQAMMQIATAFQGQNHLQSLGMHEPGFALMRCECNVKLDECRETGRMHLQNGKSQWV
jgi:hypothetical protein